MYKKKKPKKTHTQKTAQQKTQLLYNQAIGLRNQEKPTYQKIQTLIIKWKTKDNLLLIIKQDSLF